MKILGLLASAVGVLAWWDEGHAIGVSIAKSKMSDEHIAKIENLLGRWEHLYPGMSNMEHASIWADHLRCRDWGKRCGYDRRKDGIRLWNHNHWVNNNWIPLDDIDLTGTVDAHNPLPSIGINWWLEQIISDLRFEDNNGDPPADMTDKGTELSTNMHLRFLLHMYCDQHMPFHAMETYVHPHPEGDLGASVWPLAADEEDGCETFLPHLDNPEKPTDHHNIWDSMGFTYMNMFPLDLDDVRAKAEAIKEKYPEDGYETGRMEIDVMNATEIALDTFEYSTNPDVEDFYDVYMGWTFGVQGTEEAINPMPRVVGNPEGKYCPAQDELDNMRRVGEKQIALCGYRMADLLTNYIVDYLPDDDEDVVPDHIN
eukprot:GHVO01051491.1.p1 GENE.GHVO01051491.1~~GHVO01051491.1.p1  ORF type:complete len:370 (-),score=51.46 GHVO01051491.1:158-1267(-)